MRDSASSRRIVFVAALVPLVFAGMFLLVTIGVGAGEIGDWGEWVVPWYATLAQELVLGPGRLVSALGGDRVDRILNSSLGQSLYFLGYALTVAFAITALWPRVSTPPWERGWRAMARSLIIGVAAIVGTYVLLALWGSNRSNDAEVRGSARRVTYRVCDGATRRPGSRP